MDFHHNDINKDVAKRNATSSRFNWRQVIINSGRVDVGYHEIVDLHLEGSHSVGYRASTTSALKENRNKQFRESASGLSRQYSQQGGRNGRRFSLG